MQEAQRLSPDRIMQRLLFVEPRSLDMPAADATRQAERAFSFSLAFSGIRCILQYAVLPFVLPALGIAANASVPITMVIGLAAIVSMIFSMRRFWAIGYKYRWQYLFIAVSAILVLIAFTVLDLQMLAGG